MRSKSDRSDRKVHQLCKQTFRALSPTIDDLGWRSWARGMYLVEVSPAPDASRLCLTVAFGERCSLDQAERALDELRQRTGRLRWELGAAVARKRVPELVFDLLLVGGDDER